MFARPDTDQATWPTRLHSVPNFINHSVITPSMKADDIFKAKETNNEHVIRTRMLGVVSTQKKANKPMSKMCVQS